MTEGYNRLELLPSTESVMEIRQTVKRQENFCGTVEDIGEAPGGAADLVEARSICRYSGHESERFNAVICFYGLIENLDILITDSTALFFRNFLQIYNESMTTLGEE
jgi:hypothetical protein